MDVFKTRPGKVESIMIDQQRYLAATEAEPPYVTVRDGRTRYYAVCPLCDNPIVIVGLFRPQEESRDRRPYGRHVAHDVRGLCRYDHEAYLACPYAHPDRAVSRRKRPPKDLSARALWSMMRDEFDRVAMAWELYSGIHLGVGLARQALTRWRNDEVWRYYEATYRNLPQSLFYGAQARNMVGLYVRSDSALRERLERTPEIRLEKRPGGYMQIGRIGRRFLSMDFRLRNHVYRTVDDERLEERFDLRVLVEGHEAFPDMSLATDPDWFGNADGFRDRRLLDVARYVLRER